MPADASATSAPAGNLNYTLGLDLGIASIGWALVRLGKDGRPAGVERMGSHIFESGTEGNADQGRDASRAGPRRMARAQRKLFRRRSLRKRVLLKHLQRAGLIPGGPEDLATSERIYALLKALDKDLRAAWEPAGCTDHRARQLLPYRLRAAACARPLAAHEVGRALYHLAQRRGYLSNRRDEAARVEHDTDAATKAEAAVARAKAEGEASAEEKQREDPSVVRRAIVDLDRRLEAGGFATLGAFLASLDPARADGTGERIRNRWTAREMFQKEFKAIWETQAPHHPGMTADVRSAIERAIFYQRPLRSAKHLIGECELVPGAKRAPVACRVAQRFRLLAAVNNLKVRLPDDTERRLTAEERARLIHRLQTEGDVAFSKLRTKDWFGRGMTFNLEEGGEKRLVGNRTEAKLRRIFGDARWSALSEADKEAVVEDLLSFEKPEALKRRGVKRWGLPAETAGEFGQLLLEAGYAAHSRAALAKLVARMEEGIEYATAKKEEFPASFIAGKTHDLLPPVEEAVGNLRNPAVVRALTEARKLINAIVRRYGKPASIRVELARELKKARKLRERLAKENRQRQGERERIAERVIREAGVARPSRDDIERVLLAEECGWMCPYTGRSFALADVVGHHPRMDTEHIWPLSKSLDNGFGNKTLCWHEENRARKRNRTPFEAYHGTPQWDAIVERVKRFRGDSARGKLRRFLAPEMDEGFAERQLTETRYMATRCAEYVGLLYGGYVDAGGTRRVFTPSGGLTFHLRREWMLDAILSGKGETPEAMKNRGDHRHHAIDALVIALTDQGAVQRLQKAAEEASAEGRRLFARVEEPWPEFVESVRKHVEAINVSCRQRRRVRGKLHADSLYSKPHGKDGERRIRKPVESLTPAMVEMIVDPHVKAAVKSKLAALGKTACKDAFKDRASHPTITGRDGVARPIHRVRIAVSETARAIASGPGGGGPRERFVGSTDGSNYQTEVWKVAGPKGKARGELVVIPRIEARGRKRPPDGNGRSFHFALAIGDYLLMPRPGGEKLYRVTATSEDCIVLVEHTDGRPRDERIRTKDYIRERGTALLKARKVRVDYFGEVRRVGE